MSVPQQVPHDRHDRDAVDRALDRACGSRAIPGNSVSHLTDGPQAYATMKDLIVEAERTLWLENYMIHDDQTGQQFADLLVAAAKRKVQVRVLYDAFGSRGTGSRFWSRLRDAGITVQCFNPINVLYPRRSMRRDHRKYLSADGKRAVVGGLCIGDEWAGNAAQQQLPWRDTAVDICGPAVPALDLAFDRIWKMAGGTPLPRALSRVDPCGEATVRVIEGAPGRRRVERTVYALAGGVAERLWITDAYLVAPPTLFAALLSAARDQVDVRLLLPGRTDIPVVRAFTRAGYRELLEAGVRIFEWSGPMLHAKTVLVDYEWVKVGSSNLNSSSLARNFELDVLVTDQATAQAAAAQFRLDLAGAAEIVLKPSRVPRIPPAVVSAGPVQGPPHRLARGERSRRAVVSLRSVAVGARRSIAGALLFLSVGAGVFALFAPRVLASLVAFISFTLAGRAIWNFLWRRREREY